MSAVISSNFHLRALGTIALHFEERGDCVGMVGAPITDDQPSEGTIRAQLHVQPHPEAAGLFQVVLDVEATPDPRVQPYSARCVVAGLFEAPADANDAVIDGFARVNAPMIIWPYVREHLTRASSDARMGALVLPPINILALLAESTTPAQAKNKRPSRARPGGPRMKARSRKTKK